MTGELDSGGDLGERGEMADVTTLEAALEWVQEVGICTLFSGKTDAYPALWDVVDLPTEGGGRTKWGARVEAVWTWKNELPETYPDEIFYGKAKGGLAVLMSMDYLRETHYPAWHKPVAKCSRLAQEVYQIARLNPTETAEIRREAMETLGCSKSRFETALKELQVTLNVVRSNAPGTTRDVWVPFGEQYAL